MELLLLIMVVGGVKPEGSEALPFGPKNHSKVGEGTSEGRGTGSKRIAEQLSEYVSPAIVKPEEEMVTGSNPCMYAKFTRMRYKVSLVFVRYSIKKSKSHQ